MYYFIEREFYNDNFVDVIEVEQMKNKYVFSRNFINIVWV